MKKMKLLSAFLGVLTLFFTACQDKWNEESTVTEAPPLTYDQEFAIINNYTSIDTANYRYAVVITDEIMQAERLTPRNVNLIMHEINKINKRIEKDVKDGIITTLTITNNQGFKSYTANVNNSNIKFTDTPISKEKTAKTRGRQIIGGMSFTDGNWNNFSSSFEASDHVTSTLSVASCRGYWSTGISCTTGTSSYGNVFRAYGSSSTPGINRYWWYTGGGSAPFSWYFTSGGPIGGNATGDFAITNTY